MIHAQRRKKMSGNSTSSPGYLQGSLPNKIKQFIKAATDTDAYRQRSHSHHSLVNAYMVATFLEEASQYVPPMKRDAGLRDLAQRLHLWPGDMAMQLQRDALQAIELLDKYVQQSLAEELKFIERSSDAEQGLVETLTHMRSVKDKTLEDLGCLKTELREQILNHHLNFSSTDLEPHDLSPFIPNFTSARAKPAHATPTKPSPSSSNLGSVASLSHSYNLLTNSSLSPERTKALAAIENFRDVVKTVADDFADILNQGSMKLLEEKVEKMAAVQEAFERMGMRLYRLLNAGGQRDYKGDLGSSRVE